MFLKQSDLIHDVNKELSPQIFNNFVSDLSVLQKLVDQGNTIIVIEHNLDVVKCADWIIDLGPEGGEGGGTVVAQGTVDELSKNKASITGKFLKKVLK